MKITGSFPVERAYYITIYVTGQEKWEPYFADVTDCNKRMPFRSAQ